MKLYKIIIILIFFLFIQGMSFSEIIKHPDVKPFIPMVMAMGGGYVGQSEGLYSLWINPAGLANNYKERVNYHKGQEITAATLSLKLQPLPYDVITVYQGMSDLFKEKTEGLGPALTILHEKSMRVAPSLYGGYVRDIKFFKKRYGYYGTWGVALTNTIDTYLNSYGSLLSTSALAIGQMELMSGYAYNYSLGLLNMRAGISFRPFLRSHNDVPFSTLVTGIVDGDPVKALKEKEGLQGAGIGTDIGLQIDWKGLFYGMTFKDIFTPIVYNQVPPVTLFTFKGVGRTIIDDLYVIPFSMNIGGGYTFKPRGFSSKIINFTLYGQLTDTLGSANTAVQRKDFLTRLHFGGSITFLPPLYTLALGINQGYFTMGAKVKIGIFHLSYVLYTLEEGARLGEKPSPGQGIEISFKW